jgi:hypothetical protein
LTWKPRGVKRWDTRWANKVADTDDGHGYLRIGIHGKLYAAHRICYALANDIDLADVPPEVDHEDGCGTNNRKLNLRASDRGTNAKNGRIRKRNKTGYKGVDIHKGSIRVSIMTDGVFHQEQGFATLELAHARYLELSGQWHKEFGCGNVNGILA